LICFSPPISNKEALPCCAEQPRLIFFAEDCRRRYLRAVVALRKREYHNNA
jgi:hypothetical protein